MKTRISKHGKYEIREGVANEVKDSLEPGDILICPDGDYMLKAEVVYRIQNRADYFEACERLQTTVTRLVALQLAESHNADFSSQHMYLVHIVDDDTYCVWVSELAPDTPVKIKHPLLHDEPIVADKVEADTITANRVFTDDTVELPDKPGLYRDNSDDILRVYWDAHGRLRYIYIVFGGHIHHLPYIGGGLIHEVAEFAPFTRIRTVEQLRKTLNAEVES